MPSAGESAAEGAGASLGASFNGGRNPPVIVIHGNALDKLPDAYRRYLEHVFRDVFKLHGTPLRIQFNVSQNPFADRKKPEQNRRNPKAEEKPRPGAASPLKPEACAKPRPKPRPKPKPPAA